MAVEFVVLAALVAMAHCTVVPVARVDTDYTSFAYDVADPNTGDFKSQVETRVGGNVAGQYSLLDADGTKRTVDYTADDGGFKAVVRKDPVVVAAPVVSTPVLVAPVVAAEPEVIAARTFHAPAVYTTHGVPSVYSSFAPSVYSSVVVPSFYSAPAVYPAPLPYYH